MTKMEFLANQPQQIYSINDLALLWGIPDRSKLTNLVGYYVKAGRLISPYRGFYTTKLPYDTLELAQKITAPSYISYSTALTIHGISFQYNGTNIHVMGQKSITIKKPPITITVHKLKDSILFNSTGIEKNRLFWLASPERAVCDTLYLHPSYGFDHLESLDPQKLLDCAQIYENKKLLQRVKQLVKTFQQGGHHA